jgi:hypothetical protein
MRRKRAQQLKSYVLVSQVRILNIITLDEFTEYINYTRNLDFEQEPDYEYLRGLFKQVMTKYNFVNDFDYDWSKKYGIHTIKV